MKVKAIKNKKWKNTKETFYLLGKVSNSKLNEFKCCFFFKYNSVVVFRKKFFCLLGKYVSLLSFISISLLSLSKVCTNDPLIALFGKFCGVTFFLVTWKWAIKVTFHFIIVKVQLVICGIKNLFILKFNSISAWDT